MRKPRIREILDRLKRMIGRSEPEWPGDPYVMVGTPKKPRPPLRSRAAAEPLD
jgi:hypothetical protein